MHLSPADVKAEFIDSCKILPSTLNNLHDLKQRTINVVNYKFRKRADFAKLVLLTFS